MTFQNISDILGGSVYSFYKRAIDFFLLKSSRVIRRSFYIRARTSPSSKVGDLALYQRRV